MRERNSCGFVNNFSRINLNSYKTTSMTFKLHSDPRRFQTWSAHCKINYMGGCWRLEMNQQRNYNANIPRSLHCSFQGRGSLLNTAPVLIGRRYGLLRNWCYNSRYRAKNPTWLIADWDGCIFDASMIGARSCYYLDDRFYCFFLSVEFGRSLTANPSFWLPKWALSDRDGFELVSQHSKDTASRRARTWIRFCFRG